MNKLPLRIGQILTVGIIGLAIFHAGRNVGVNAAEAQAENKNYLLMNLNAVASYVSYAKMAEQIGDQRINEAKCTANVVASAHLRQVKECLMISGCRQFIYDEVQKSAPEILVGADLKFTYYEDSEACFSVRPDK